MPLPVSPTDLPLTAVANYHCWVGEGPFYDWNRNDIFWSDIEAGRLFTLDLDTGKHRQIYSGQPVGGFTLQPNGELLLFRKTDVALFNPETGTETSLLPFEDEGSHRFNDVCALPSGGVLAGTIGKTAESGGLFHLSPDLKLTLLFRGTGCANGMGFSPDDRTLYFSDSTANAIFAFDLDSQNDKLTNRRTFHQATKDEGTCDGLTTDTLGRLYSARWGGSAIRRYLPDGTLDLIIPVPVSRVTSLAFAGQNLDQIYISTATGHAPTDPPEENEDGALFHLPATLPPLFATGRREFVSRIGG